MIADAQLAATEAAGTGEAVVAFMNSGGIRADFTYAGSLEGEGDGNVTYGEAFTVQPFGNSLVTMTLTGAQIETLLEQQWELARCAGCSRSPRGSPTLGTRAAPIGERVDPAASPSTA